MPGFSHVNGVSAEGKGVHIVGAEQLRGALLRVWPARPLSDEEQASEGRRGRRGTRAG